MRHITLLKFFPAALFFFFHFNHAAAQGTENNYISAKTALQQNAGRLRGRHFIAFPERREQPLIWLDSLRPDWISKDYAAHPYLLQAQPGEYFVFQTGILAIHSLNALSLHYSDLKNKQGDIIPSTDITCFNAGGINYLGKPFTKPVSVPSGKVQALWIGIKVPPIAKGDYTGVLTVVADGISQKIAISLAVSGDALTDHGFDEGNRLSRLFWLNSTLGFDHRVTKGYLPVVRNDMTLKILGRSMELGSDGLPSEIKTYFTPSNQSIEEKGSPVVDRHFHFIIEQVNGTIIHFQPGKMTFTGASPAAVSWRVVNTSPECELICSGTMEFDGFVSYHLTVKAKKLLQIKDIRLDIPVEKDKAIYMMGLNKAGGFRPASWNWEWDTAKNQDALWLGAVNGGLRIKWKAENYMPPLVNVYYTYGRLHLPPSWGNAGKGGVHVYEKNNEVIVSAYSGTRTLNKDEKQHYDFELLITPFKTMNKAVQFGARYYHSGKNTTDGYIHEADSLGSNIITVHQGNDLYPFINYPYSDVNVTVLKDFIARGHQDHKRVKVYYTTRELTINLPELWTFLSLNGEVVYPGPGAASRTVTNPRGPDPWLLKNLRDRKYIPAWVAHFTEGKYAGMQDLSVITTPDSRLNNFYVAGLDWMVHHLKIDGIYIDDCSLDRTTIQRVRKLLDHNRPGANIDMHSWNHFNGYAGWASCLNLYMDLLPYIDQLWIGEGRNYDTPPDYWLVEISGIPFGLPGQMLQDGGNPWRGMVYGMTNRAGWTGTPPDHIWKFWDRYRIEDKTMIGYWDPNNPVTTDNDSVKVTVYKGNHSAILAVANFSGNPESCSVHINDARLGWNPSGSTFYIPGIPRYQQEQKLSSLDHVSIPAKKGYLIVIESK